MACVGGPRPAGARVGEAICRVAASPARRQGCCQGYCQGWTAFLRFLRKQGSEGLHRQTRLWGNTGATRAFSRSRFISEASLPVFQRGWGRTGDISPSFMLIRSNSAVAPAVASVVLTFTQHVSSTHDNFEPNRSTGPVGRRARAHVYPSTSCPHVPFTPPTSALACNASGRDRRQLGLPQRLPG